ncbi:homoserine acetyltransferase [Plectosphaerella cucumerina]|uniref:Homoserine acetyltransferase n=1 Tax=Plectosphaerella cucumerina TaxID=40658 RepID=A0A8K0X664_9PEZI|nr:homoserine acetyltransferase [Plectosphaerella cucumerina]
MDTTKIEDSLRDVSLVPSPPVDPEVKTFPLGDFSLKSGRTIPSAFIAYKTFGSPSSPAIIYPTWYSGSIADNEWLIGPDHTLDPARFFIIVPALFGNGQSSSPSNSPTAGTPWPDVTFYDNVRAQHTLVTKGLGISHVRAVLGWSMGAGQTYQWVTQFPDFMDLGVPFCGSARTSLHNQVFLEGVKGALLAAKGAASGGICGGEATAARKYRGWTEEEKSVGLKALGRVYAGWGFSQAFYREKVYETAPTLGFKGLEDFMVGFWEKWALSKDPENMLVMLHTWQAGDCSDQEPYGKDFEVAMRSIKAKMLVLPGKTDLYFPPEDSEYEVSCMTEGTGTCLAFPSIWGHWAGGPGQSTEDVKWLDEKLRDFIIGKEA